MNKLTLILTLISSSLFAQDKYTLFRPSRVFDGETMHNNWQVLIKNQRIEAVGENLTFPSNSEIIDIPNSTLLPGLIEGHSHLLLHPYNETNWDRCGRS